MGGVTGDTITDTSLIHAVGYLLKGATQTTNTSAWVMEQLEGGGGGEVGKVRGQRYGAPVSLLEHGLGYCGGGSGGTPCPTPWVNLRGCGLYILPGSEIEVVIVSVVYF